MGLGIDELLGLNEERSRQFIKEKPKREAWRRERNVEIGWIGCMDGRVHPPTITETPLGILPLWQNVGGKFDLMRWQKFQDSVQGLRRCAMRHGRKVIWVIADHFSRSDDQRLGCRGHNCNTGLARQASRNLRTQFQEVYGADQDVYVVHVTVDTDEDAVIFHGEKENEEGLDLGLVSSGISRESMLATLRGIYPQAPEWSLSHLLEMGMKNLEHVNRIREERRGKADHEEWVIAVGRGLDCWLHGPNTALTISPFDPDVLRVVRTAATIVRHNAKSPAFDRARGTVLLVAFPYRPEDGPSGRTIASYRAKDQLEKSWDAICRLELPSLQPLAAVVNMETQRAEVLEV